jgi:hypothetical protein
MKDLKSAKLDDLNYFEDIANAVYDYIKKTWKCKVAPKGYKAFTADYEEYDGMEEVDHNAIKKAFKGFDDETAGSPSFPFKIAMPNVAYDDKEQGRNPLRCLIGAVLGYGMAIGKARGVHKTTDILSKFKRTLEIHEKYKSDNKEVNELLKYLKSDLEMAELSNRM